MNAKNEKRPRKTRTFVSYSLFSKRKEKQPYISYLLMRVSFFVLHLLQGPLGFPPQEIRSSSHSATKKDWHLSRVWCGRSHHRRQYTGIQAMGQHLVICTTSSFIIMRTQTKIRTQPLGNTAPTLFQAE